MNSNDSNLSRRHLFKMGLGAAGALLATPALAKSSIFQKFVAGKRPHDRC